MINSKLFDKLEIRPVSLTLQHILENSKAVSGGERDVNFLNYLIDKKLLVQSEAILKRSAIGLQEEHYLDRYKKVNFETDRHFLCRTMIQDELKKKGIGTFDNMAVGNMEILRSNTVYDIVLDDFSSLIDIGLTPARNFFRGLTDLKVRNYLLTSYFDDYMDDIIFSTFSRSNDQDFINAVKDYMEGYKEYIPQPQERVNNSRYYDGPSELA